MWAAIDTIADCWARMNLNERSGFWIGLVASPLWLAGSTLLLWSGLVVLSGVFLHAAADQQRPQYDAGVHRRAFILSMKLIVISTAAFVTYRLLNAGDPVDYVVASVCAVGAVWAGVSLVLLQINPRFDYNWRPLRWFDPAVPGTMKYAARQAHSETGPELTGR